jgi:hypothetical protein
MKAKWLLILLDVCYWWEYNERESLQTSRKPVIQLGGKYVTARSFGRAGLMCLRIGTSEELL